MALEYNREDSTARVRWPGYSIKKTARQSIGKLFEYTAHAKKLTNRRAKI